MDFVKKYLDEVKVIADSVDYGIIESMINILDDVRRKNGRLFFLGVGGSAANCSHAVNDFRKLAGIETYTPVDNVAELTARTNDEGWETVFFEWLKTSNLRAEDALFVLSVGGGSEEKNISANLVHATNYAKDVGTRIIGIIGRDGGHCKKVGDAVIVIPTQAQDTITPHAEAWQGVIWHMLVAHPRILMKPNKWESMDD